MSKQYYGMPGKIWYDEKIPPPYFFPPIPAGDDKLLTPALVREIIREEIKKASDASSKALASMKSEILAAIRAEKAEQKAYQWRRMRYDLLKQPHQST